MPQKTACGGEHFLHNGYLPVLEPQTSAIAPQSTQQSPKPRQEHFLSRVLRITRIVWKPPMTGMILSYLFWLSQDISTSCYWLPHLRVERYNLVLDHLPFELSCPCTMYQWNHWKILKLAFRGWAVCHTFHKINEVHDPTGPSSFLSTWGYCFF